LIYLLLKSYDFSPRKPPTVFVIASVMSVLPIAKVNWINSNVRLKPSIKENLGRKPTFLKLTFKSNPKGIKTMTFSIISMKWSPEANGTKLRLL
jgi:hypothetical protein